MSLFGKAIITASMLVYVRVIACVTACRPACLSPRGYSILLIKISEYLPGFFQPICLSGSTDFPFLTNFPFYLKYGLFRINMLSVDQTHSESQYMCIYNGDLELHYRAKMLLGRVISGLEKFKSERKIVTPYRDLKFRHSWQLSPKCKNKSMIMCYLNTKT